MIYPLCKAYLSRSRPLIHTCMSFPRPIGLLKPLATTMILSSRYLAKFLESLLEDRDTASRTFCAG